MNLVFLDVDGVLNSINHLVEYSHKVGKMGHSGINYPFDPNAMLSLQTFIKSTNSKIVISSVWRLFEGHRIRLLEELSKYDLDSQVIGWTPQLPGESRGREIASFLESFESEADSFIIIDDSSDMEELLPYLIQTEAEIGLTEAHVFDALERM
ncbi:MAG: HAD domain-containing protein [Firmicutes bacterium]|nr:HAD domain-containing protein [Bacillota bacterium]